MKRSFCKQVLLPLAALLATLLIFGCEPVAPRPVRLERQHILVVRPKVIAYGAEWCAACRAGQSFLTFLEEKGVTVERINIDEHPDLVAKYAITSIPVYFVIRAGHETMRTQDLDDVLRCINER